MPRPPRPRQAAPRTQQTVYPDTILRCQGCNKALKVSPGTRQEQGAQIVSAGWVVAGPVQGKQPEYRCGGCWRAAENTLLSVAREG